MFWELLQRLPLRIGLVVPGLLPEVPSRVSPRVPSGVYSRGSLLRCVQEFPLRLFPVVPSAIRWGFPLRIPSKVIPGVVSGDSSRSSF